MARKQLQLASIATKCILYRFICVHCGRYSGWREMRFEARSDISKKRLQVLNAVNITEKSINVLHGKAESILQQMVAYAKDEVSRGVYRTSSEMGLPAFNDICPHCQKRQNWNQNADANSDVIVVSPNPEINWEGDIDAIQEKDERQEDRIPDSLSSLNQYEEIRRLSSDSTHERVLIRETETSPLYVKHIIKNGRKDLYRRLRRLSHINLLKVLQVIQGEALDLIVIEEYTEGETLAEKVHKGIEKNVFEDFLLQICDVIELLGQLNPCIGFENISLEDFIVCNDNLLKFINLDSLILNEGEKSAEFIKSLINESPERISSAYKNILKLCEEDTVSVGAIRAAIIKAAAKNKRIMYVVGVTITFLVIFIKRVLRF
jgi:hypothetical protein